MKRLPGKPEGVSPGGGIEAATIRRGLSREEIGAEHPALPKKEHNLEERELRAKASVEGSDPSGRPRLRVLP